MLDHILQVPHIHSYIYQLTLMEVTKFLEKIRIIAMRHKVTLMVIVMVVLILITG